MEATATLHWEVGPAATTISEIARRAGVERLTVYRHFPNERELYEACGNLTNSRYPPPNPTPWREIADPDERLSTALSELYGYYRGGEQMLTFLLRDVEVMPALAQALTPMQHYYQAMVGILLAGRELSDQSRSAVEAAIRHALEFFTWRSFARQGFSDDQSVSLMVSFVGSAAATRA